MNKNKIKAYAPAARQELIAAVTAKAQILGLSDKKIEPVEIKGDVAIIAGRPFPRSIATPRRNLEMSIKREGFGVVMERIAFTWFNRFSALRYMEIHDFLDHGYRVLSHPNGGTTPEILEHATDVELFGLDKEKVAELRLAGHKDAELYRMILVAQCNTLSNALPFLFEKSNDETELLLPDNLLHSDSPIRKMVDAIEEADWNEVEIVGWLYQFYISEKKDAVIGKVVKSEDIPAATQLFTPNWIVKYLVQNTLGRKWLATYPQSGLRSNMEFYIEPAEQTDEVKAQLKAITPAELNPETITFFDPACGSGHILVEAYNHFKQIYEERGYARRDIPRLILEKNLFGLDIDERAAQLSAFALMMKARADDRSLFRSDKTVRLNVMAIQESNGLDYEEIAGTLSKEKLQKLVESDTMVQQELSGITNSKIAQPVLTVTQKPDIDKGLIRSLLQLFENAKTFGSLTQIPESLVKALPKLESLVDPTVGRDLASHTAAESLRPFVRQTRFLSNSYDNVVANPPYMGTKGMNPSLKEFAKKHFPDTKSDLFAMFIERGFGFAKPKSGYNGMVTMQSWMFLSSYEEFRQQLLSEKSLLCMVHMANGVMGIAFGTAATVFLNQHVPYVNGSFSYVDFNDLNNQNKPKEFPVKNDRLKDIRPDDFKKIPGSPIAYWVSESLISLFESPPLKTQIESGGRCKTHNDEKYVRLFWEVSCKSLQTKWRIYHKGGEARKWYGNIQFVIDWSDNAKAFYQESGGLTNSKYWNRYGITWSGVSSSRTTFRLKTKDSEYASVSPTIIVDSAFSRNKCLGALNSNIVNEMLKIVNPTMMVNVGDTLKLPDISEFVAENPVEECVQLAKADWDQFEISLDFTFSPLIKGSGNSNLKITFNNWFDLCRQMVHRMKKLEIENNQALINALGLENEISSNVPTEQITMFINPQFRYGTNLSDEEYETRFRCDTTKELLSYAVGCMMGRYSLDKPGLIYANAGNEDFDPEQYKTFPADDDGIIPICDIEWFSDDATPRLVEFIKTAFGAEHLDENLGWIAESFEPKKGESAIETIRRYFSTQFFKNHMQMYKKRPIYWLFSSGKQKAFECLVYLHRYNESTLSRMRAQYVTPLQGKLNARIEHLRREIDSASSTSGKNKLVKEVEALTKKQTELAKFDEELRHYADQRIKLDLDDGVRVNYGKFGNLLAETKAIAAGDDE